MTNSRIKLGAVAMAMLLLLPMVLGAAAAAPTFDDETANTSTQSEVGNTGSTVTFDASNENESLYVETDGVTAASEDLKLVLTPQADGLDGTALYTNSSAATEDAAAGHYSFNVSYDELTYLARDADGGSYDVKIKNDSSGDTILDGKVTLDQSGDSDAMAVVYVADASATTDATGSDLTAEGLDIMSEQPGFFGDLAGAETTNQSSWAAFTTVDGENTTVVYQLQNDSTAAAYDRAAEGLDDGDMMTGVTFWANNVPQRVYKGDPGNVTGSYATYNAETNRLTFHSGPAQENINTLAVSSSTSEGYSITTKFNNFGAMAALGGIIDGLASWVPLL